MSLAVTARVMPCRPLFFGMAIICCAVVFLGMSIALSLIAGHLPLLLRVLLGCTAIVAAVTGLVTLRAYYHVVWVDISADGRIQLAVDEVAHRHAAFPRMKAQTAHLLPHSTLLPYVMLWQLRCETGAIVYVPIFPGTVSPEIFRALSLASHQIAGSPPFR